MHSKYFKTCLVLFSLACILAIYTTASAQSPISITLHYVEAVPDEKQTVYDVKAFLSVLDVNDNPIKDLTPENFSISQDGQYYDVISSELTTDEPINILLVIDTSQSMKDQKIKDARDAASAFIERLGSQDKVAILTFNTSYEIKIDFTSDLAAAQDQIRLIETIPFSSTCLYDALHQSVLMMNTKPSGRRSIILLTDGVDETPEKTVCSKYTIDDVINLASASTSRVPIYAIGLGNRIDEPGLIRLTRDTGGRYLYSPESDALDAQFRRLTDQLRSQYILRYQSTGTLGDHNVTVTVNYQQHQNFASRGVLLPGLPLHLTFLSPIDGSTLTSPVTKMLVVASSTSSGEAVASVTFKFGDQILESDSTVPYELDFNTFSFPSGGHQLIAVAIGESGTEITQTSITVYISPPPTPTITAIPLTLTATPPPPLLGYGQIGLGCLGIILVAIFVLSLLNYRRGKLLSQKISKPTDKFQMTYDDQWEENKSALAVLTVINSDDFNAGYKKLNVLKSPITLGRSSDNDIAFPNEKPVSRHHAEIFEKNGELYIKEIYSKEDSNEMIPPKFGTFVNETKVGENGLRLRSNDRIRLGKRLTLLVDIPILQTKPAVSDIAGSVDEEIHEDVASDQTNETNFDPDQTNVAPIDPDQTDDANIAPDQQTDNEESDLDRTNDANIDPDRTNP
jgi:Ca-activated chloride channel homolog